MLKRFKVYTCLLLVTALCFSSVNISFASASTPSERVFDEENTPIVDIFGGNIIGMQLSNGKSVYINTTDYTKPIVFPILDISTDKIIGIQYSDGRTEYFGFYLNSKNITQDPIGEITVGTPKEPPIKGQYAGDVPLPTAIRPPNDSTGISDIPTTTPAPTLSPKINQPNIIDIVFQIGSNSLNTACTILGIFNDVPSNYNIYLNIYNYNGNFQKTLVFMVSQIEIGTWACYEEIPLKQLQRGVSHSFTFSIEEISSSSILYETPKESVYIPVEKKYEPYIPSDYYLELKPST